jgi:hypothetical protein
MLAQRVEQRDTCVKEQPLLPAVHGEMHEGKRAFAFHWPTSRDRCLPIP